MDEEPKIEVQTSVDMLISRMETHPHEFFNAELLPKLQATSLLEGCKWGRLAAHICSPTSHGLFSTAEKERFATALDRIMREALDVLIVQSLVTNEPFEKKPTMATSTMATSTLTSAQMQGLYQNAGMQNSQLGSVGSITSAMLGSNASAAQAYDYDRQMNTLSMEMEYEKVRRQMQAAQSPYSLSENMIRKVKKWWE